MHWNVFDQDERVIKKIDNTFGNFLLEKGLYDSIEITKENIYELADLVGGHVRINTYCPKCKDSRVFSCETINVYCKDGDGGIDEFSLEDQIITNQKYLNAPKPRFVDTPEEPWQWKNWIIADAVRVMVFKFCCSMDESHRLDFVVTVEGNIMRKIGQYPSVADLTMPELKIYKKVMNKDDERELKRANGLYASGIGIGSFVYLRRIIERIVVKAGEMAIEEGKINEKEFNQARIGEKIKLLSDYLPKGLCENPVFYGIVSKGIHELSEEECLKYFPIMNSFILMVLRQWKKMQDDAEEEKQIAASLNKIASTIN